jgi:hypothetical protein
MIAKAGDRRARLAELGAIPVGRRLARRSPPFFKAEIVRSAAVVEEAGLAHFE